MEEIFDNFFSLHNLQTNPKKYFKNSTIFTIEVYQDPAVVKN